MGLGCPHPQRTATLTCAFHKREWPGFEFSIIHQGQRNGVELSRDKLVEVQRSLQIPWDGERCGGDTVRRRVRQNIEVKVAVGFRELNADFLICDLSGVEINILGCREMKKMSLGHL